MYFSKTVVYIKDYLATFPAGVHCWQKTHARRVISHQNQELKEIMAYREAGECQCCGSRLTKKED